MKHNFLILIFFSTTVFAQTDRQMYERDFKRAISYYNQGEYLQALNNFTPLTSSRFNYSETPYAHYYYALASLKVNQVVQGRFMLQQLVERFPSWKKIDEANYLYANALFKEKKYESALTQLMAVRSSAMSKDIESMKNFFVRPLQDVVLLKNLYKVFPADKVVGMTLADALKKSTSLTSQEKDILDILASKYNLEKGGQVVVNQPSTSLPVTSSRTPNWKKGYYQVAVLMPFKVEDTAPKTKPVTNQYAYDLYEGMRLATEKLATEGINIKLATFDIENNAEATKSIVATQNFQQSDLIVGPLHQQSVKVVREYAEANKVFMINPVSLTNDANVNQSFSLNLQPSLDRQAASLFGFAKGISDFSNKKIAIYIGPNRRDTTLANLYRIKAQAAGYQIIDYRKTREKIDSTASISVTNKPTHVAVFSGSNTDGRKVLAMMSKRNISVPMVSNLSAFDIPNTGGSGLKSVYFFDTDFYDNSRPNVKEFLKKYMADNNTIAPPYAMQGYDMMLYFGRNLHKYKEKLRDGLNATTIFSDLLMNDLNFRQSNENMSVPILRFDGDRFVIVE